MIIFTSINDLNQSDLSKYDYCIIGAGIGGLLLADNLDVKQKILLIESGDFTIQQEFQILNKIDFTGRSFRNNGIQRIRQFGGACNLWAGRSLILNESDLLHRSWIENSGWPISYHELIHYYKKVSNKYSFPPFSSFLDVCTHKINDIDFDILNFEKVGISWAKNTARFGFNSKFYKTLLKKSNIDLLLKSTVTKLDFDNGVVTSCTVKDSNFQSIRIFSKNFILATGGIENARILLSSKNSNKTLGNESDNVGRFFMDHPTYVSKTINLNSSINYTSMFHTVKRDYRAKQGLRFSDNYQMMNGLTNNYVEINPSYPKSISNSFDFILNVGKSIKSKKINPNLFGKFNKTSISGIKDSIFLLTPPELLPHIVNKYFNYYNHNYRKINSIVISHHLEQTPNRDNRITLSNKINEYGINHTVLNWEINHPEIKTANLMEHHILNYLANQNLIYKNQAVKYYSNLSRRSSFNDASHHMGTTRMSTSKQNGVVNPDLLVFDTSNLFIIGSSVFPTSGYANPTYTIAALSLRLADHLNSRM